MSKEDIKDTYTLGSHFFPVFGTAVEFYPLFTVLSKFWFVSLSVAPSVLVALPSCFWWNDKKGHHV